MLGKRLLQAFSVFLAMLFLVGCDYSDMEAYCEEEIYLEINFDFDINTVCTIFEGEEPIEDVSSYFNMHDLDVEVLGDYELTLSYKKGLSMDTVTMLIHVVDTEKPVITLNFSDDVTHNINDPYEDLGVVITDNSLEEIEVVIDASEVDVHTEGTYQVYYNASDSSGNQADTVVRQVTIADIEGPEFFLASNIVYDGIGVIDWEFFVQNRTDNSSDELTLTVDESTLDYGKPGNYIVELYLTDEYGNTTPCKTKVTVVQAFGGFIVDLNYDVDYDAVSLNIDNENQFETGDVYYTIYKLTNNMYVPISEYSNILLTEDTIELSDLDKGFSYNVEFKSVLEHSSVDAINHFEFYVPEIISQHKIFTIIPSVTTANLHIPINDAYKNAVEHIEIIETATQNIVDTITEVTDDFSVEGLISDTSYEVKYTFTDGFTKYYSFQTKPMKTGDTVKVRVHFSLEDYTDASIVYMIDEQIYSDNTFLYDEYGAYYEVVLPHSDFDSIEEFQFEVRRSSNVDLLFDPFEVVTYIDEVANPGIVVDIDSIRQREFLEQDLYITDRSNVVSVTEDDHAVIVYMLSDEDLSHASYGVTSLSKLEKLSALYDVFQPSFGSHYSDIDADYYRAIISLPKDDNQIRFLNIHELCWSCEYIISSDKMTEEMYNYVYLVQNDSYIFSDYEAALLQKENFNKALEVHTLFFVDGLYHEGTLDIRTQFYFDRITMSEAYRNATAVLVDPEGNHIEFYPNFYTKETPNPFVIYSFDHPEYLMAVVGDFNDWDYNNPVIIDNFMTLIDISENGQYQVMVDFDENGTFSEMERSETLTYIYETDSIYAVQLSARNQSITISDMETSFVSFTKSIDLDLERLDEYSVQIWVEINGELLYFVSNIEVVETENF